MLLNAQGVNQAPQLMPDLCVLSDMRWGVWQRLHPLQKPVFTSLSIMKYHHAMGGYW